MGKRYGRNQRRAHRERIEELEKRVAALARESASLNRAASLARAQLYDAKTAALNDWLQQEEQLKFAIETISYEMGRTLGERLMPVAEKIMASDRRRPPNGYFSLSARSSHVGIEQGMVTDIRGVIEPIHYNFRVMEW